MLRWKNIYFFCASLMLTVVTALLLINGTCSIVIYLRDCIKNSFMSEAKKNELDDIRAKLIGMSHKELSILEKETWAKRWRYEPWVSFSEKARKGKYVNVMNGYRLTRGTPQNAKYLICLFGGSTTFGYNVTDGQTIASHLQMKINEKYDRGEFEVRNYGRGYYYSEQELILLLQLIKQGVYPSVVIFLDGLNEGQKRPYYTNELTVLFDQIQESPIIILGKNLSLIRALRFMGKKIARHTQKKKEEHEVEEIDNAMLDNYLFTQNIIRKTCEIYNIVPYFFIQPVPEFNNYRSNIFLDDEDRHALNLWNQHGRKIEILRNLSKKGLVIDISDLLSKYDEQAYVDGCHYSPKVNGMIADAIFSYIKSDLNKLSVSK